MIRGIKRKNRGVTLIALIITIIVLLILAGVSISMVAGDNGILTQAVNAADSNNLAEVKSDLSLALASCQTNYFADRYGDGGNDVKVKDYFTTDNIKKEMGDEYSSVTGTVNIGSESTLTITKTDGKVYTAKITITDNGGVTISSVTYSGTSSGSVAVETISTAESFVGYYADINADGVVDGVIYADLMDSDNASGEWGSNGYGSYSYEVISSAKDYYVIQEDYEGDFGTADVLAPTGSGADRFYVMALSDFDSDSHYWYYSACKSVNSGTLDSSNIVAYSTNDFGEGFANTTRMIRSWNAEEYGTQNGGSSSTDLWGIIQTEYDDGWFVPSKSEWACFGAAFGVTISNYGDYGLSYSYWFSSQYSTYQAFCSYFFRDTLGFVSVNSTYFVRLSITF